MGNQENPYEQYLADHDERSLKFLMDEIVNEVTGDEEAMKIDKDIEGFIAEFEEIAKGVLDFKERMEGVKELDDESFAEINSLVERRDALKKKAYAWMDYYAEEVPEIAEAAEEVKALGLRGDSSNDQHE